MWEKEVKKGGVLHGGLPGNGVTKREERRVFGIKRWSWRTVTEAMFILRLKMSYFGLFFFWLEG